MKNKIAALVAATVLTSTVGNVPSYALNTRGNIVHNRIRNSEIIDLGESLNQITDETATTQAKADNAEVLIAQRRYRRRRLRRRRRRGYRRFRGRVIDRRVRRRIFQRIRRPTNRRRLQRTRPVRRRYYNR